MRYMIAVVAVLAACTTTKVSPTDTTHAVISVPIMDSTVQHKIAPDTLVRGDGAKCVVNAPKYAVAALGQPFICDWK